MRQAVAQVVMLGWVIAWALVPVAWSQDRGLEFFEKKIRPVLIKHCYQCHSAQADEVQGELLLDSRQGILQGGASGPAVVPGKPQESLLLEALRYESLEMPPEGKLPDHIIRDFERWILLGAPAPEGKKPVKSYPPSRNHWAFRPVKQPSLPKVQNPQWCWTAVDRFVLARIEAQALSPGREASEEVLVRRLYLDLWGLPPTPEQLEEYFADSQPGRWQRLVDRLLADPRFGQRWGRHWLDVVRYADSSGGGRSLLFHQAWRFRDYVVRSFNQDKPLDRLILEHIAGDLLPSSSWEQKREQLVATGFLLLGPINYELQDKVLLRMEVVDEQISTIGKAFLGMSLGCARCHNHKFDPIPMRDYYALAGIFRSTKSLVPGNVSGFNTRELPLPPEQQQALIQFRQKLKQLQAQSGQLAREIQHWEARSLQLRGFQLERSQVVDDTQAQLLGNWSASRSAKPFFQRGYHYAPANGKHIARFACSLPPGRYLVQTIYSPATNRSSKAIYRIHHAGGTATVELDQRQRALRQDGFVELGEFEFSGQGVVELWGEGGGVVIADAVRWVPQDPQARATEEQIQQAQNQLRKLRAQQTQVLQQLHQLRRQAPGEPPRVMAVQDHEEVGDWHICIRGDVRKLGPKVPRGFLSVVGPLGIDSIPKDQSGRLQLAQWIVHPQNPLTARVYVNRVWYHLLGRGIVPTVDNFGTTGQEPSHPELLDYLAGWFVRHGWSTKALVRLLVCSRVYRLSSDPRQPQSRQDPQNRWFWRAERKPLEAEAIRDAMLLVSGQLDWRMGGPSLPAGLKREFGYRYTTRRRSLYAPVLRNTLMDVYVVFDFANPNLVVGRRPRSVLPTQALWLMNSPFVLQQAQHLAQRILNLPEATLEQRVRRAYRIVLAREPQPQELQACLEFLNQQGPDSLDAWAQLCQSLFCTLEFRYIY